MKKITFLLAAIFAALTVSAQAPEAYMLKPAGTFHSGYAAGTTSLTYLSNGYMHVPGYTDLTFEDYSNNATSIQWSYPNYGDIFNPTSTSTESSITVNFPAIRPETINPVKLTATNDEGSATTTDPKYIRVGGGPMLGSSGTEFPLSNYSPLYGTGLSYSTSYYSLNTAKTVEYWQGKADGATINGLGETFFAPASPMALTGVFVPCRRVSNTISGNVMVELYKIETSATGMVTKIVEKFASQTIAGEDVHTIGTGVACGIKFDKLVGKDGKLLGPITLDFPLMVIFSVSDPTTELCMYYRPIPNDLGESHCVARMDNGKFYNAGLNWSSGNKTRSFLFGLYASFETIVNTEGAKESTMDLTETGYDYINLFASQPYSNVDYSALKASADINWTITQADGSALPEWLTLDIVDDIDDGLYNYATCVNVTAEENLSGESRSCDVVFSFVGSNKYTLHIVQDATTTGIDNVKVNKTDANAPVYNTMGQRVNLNEASHGIFIQNGKKFVK